MTRNNHTERGSSMLTVLLLAALASAILLAYAFLTQAEMSMTKSSMDAMRGYYAAEAGLNVRAEEIRTQFLGYRRPTGTTPTAVDGANPCSNGSAGSGAFRCSSLYLESHDVSSYVEEDAGNPKQIVIPPGETYQNLSAQEYTYRVHSIAQNGRDSRPEAILEMHFRSRLVPMFQFAAFYNKDLEILPGPDMTLAGPVHSNGDLYVGCGGTLTIDGQVTTAGSLWHGRKDKNACSSGDAAVMDPASPRSLPVCSGGRTEVSDADASSFNGQVLLGVDEVTVPPAASLDPIKGQPYWDSADLRVMYDVDDGALQFVDPSGIEIVPDTSCGAISLSSSFYNRREKSAIEMIEVDARALLDCLYAEPKLMGGRGIDDVTDGGLVWYFGFKDGAPIGAPNNYGVRIANGATLAATTAGAPPISGLTVVTNQAVYVQGDYNDTDWKPAAFLADSLNVLSNAWRDSWEDTSVGLGSRLASETTINAAFFAGTDISGNAEGSGGQDKGDYNGGLENYPRFHEKWSGKALNYLGSFVSLDTPRHVDGAWSTGGVYSPPIRNWGYDLRFNDASNLPPLSPRFVYLKQDLFVRHYEL